MANNTAASDLHNLLLTHNFEVSSKDSSGKPENPAAADMFSFDYEVNNNNYGTVVILFDESGALNLFHGDNIGKGMKRADRQEWFDFLYQISMFAKKNCPTFEMYNINRLKDVLAGMAAIKEGLFEGYYGTRKISYSGDQTNEARLMIKHNRKLGEADARYRYIESLFIETKDGERFKLPFKNLAGGKAMLEHVRHGGRPYDIRGNHITEMVSDVLTLSRFNRASQNKVFEGETGELVEASKAYYESSRKTLKSLGKSRGYKKYFESWSPDQVLDSDNTISSIKEMFIEQTLDSRIEDALPILAKLQQRETTMKQADIFEAWAERITEGTWALPETPDQIEELKQFLSKEQPVGPDAANVTDTLYGIIGDDQLFDDLWELANEDPDADARNLVINRLEDFDFDFEEVGINLNEIAPALAAIGRAAAGAAVRGVAAGMASSSNTTADDIDEEELNELDLAAPKQTYVRTGDGSYKLAKYRSTGALTGSGANDSAMGIKVVDVDPATVKKLQLDQRVDYMLKKKDGTSYKLSPTISQGHDIQGGTPFSRPEITAYDINSPEFKQHIPMRVQNAIVKSLTTQSIKEGECAVCDGTGKLDSDTPCQQCGGKGHFNESKSKASCGCNESCSHCGGKHTSDEIGNKCECCGNTIKEVTNEASDDDLELARFKQIIQKI